MRDIKTSCQFPPIPDRRFDWLAYFEGDEEGPQGWGATEDAAIADLIDNYIDDDAEAEEYRRREREAEARHGGGLSPLGEALVEAAFPDIAKEHP